jgi:site-specific DNA-methyltransferase (adenine-specific)
LGSGGKGALADEGSLFLNLGAPPSRPMMPHSIICSIVEAGIFTLQNTFHWIKSIAVPDDGNGGQTVQRGHYKPINSRRFVHDCHEYLFHLTKRGDVDLDRLALGVPYTDESNIERWNHTQGSDLHCRGNTWFIPYRTIRDRVKDRPHPATFPVELVVNCIKLHGKCCPIVMDPFLGIGNAAIAAAECEAKEFIGFEIDPEYVAIARRGLERIEVL